MKMLIVYYLITMNVIGFALMGIDKNKAKRHQWRIKEKTLFSIAIFGGSVGSIAGMQIFRHKTKHSTFVFGMPIILILQILFVYLLIV